MKAKKIGPREVMFEPGSYTEERSGAWVYWVIAFCTAVIFFHYFAEKSVLAHFGV